MQVTRQMKHRVTGVLIAGLSIYAIRLSISALLNSAGFATFMADQAAIDGHSFHKADFLSHWRTTYATATFLAGAGLVAGTAMVLLKRWSWLLAGCIAISCVLLSLLSIVTGYSRYGFERLGWVAFAGLVVFGVLAIFAYRKWGRVAGDASNA